MRFIKAKYIILTVLIVTPVFFSMKAIASITKENIIPRLSLSKGEILDGENKDFNREYILERTWKISNTNSGFNYLVSETKSDKEFAGRIVDIDSLEVETPIDVKGEGSEPGNMRRFDWDIRINAKTVAKELTPQYAIEKSSVDLEALRWQDDSNMLKLVSEIPKSISSFPMNWTYNFKTGSTPANSKIKLAHIGQIRVEKNDAMAIQLFIWTACKNKCEFTLKQPKIRIKGKTTSLRETTSSKPSSLPEQATWLFAGIGVVIVLSLAYVAFGWYYKRSQRKKLEDSNETKLQINNSGNFHIVGKNSLDDHRILNTSGDSYSKSINTGGGDYVQGNYINMSQDLTYAAPQIQSLIEQREKNGVPVHDAQEQVAREISTQAQSDPTMRSKLIKWGQSLGDAAISDVVKGVVKLGLRFAGIPLP